MKIEHNLRPDGLCWHDCTGCEKEKKQLAMAAVALGTKGGLVRSKKKAKASRLNGKKGGRPIKKQRTDDREGKEE